MLDRRQGRRCLLRSRRPGLPLGRLPAPRKSLSLRGEEGAVLVWLAVMLGTLLFFFSFVVDVANWFEHRRHLQVQADAAAFAGGSAFKFPCNDGINAEIEGVARDYGGRHLGHTTPSPYSGNVYNDQVGGTPPERMRLLINSSAFWNEGGTDYSDGGTPCATGFIDVRLTESNLPWLVPFGGTVVPAINARARVHIQQAIAFSAPGLVPFFVRDIDPKAGAVLFIRENPDGTKNMLDAEYMTKASTCQSGLACWSNAASPASVSVADADQRTSAVIAVSSVKACPDATGSEPCMSLSGGMQTICAQFGVECYSADGSNVRSGLVYLQAYEDDGSGGEPPERPQIRDVHLGGITCPGGSFAYTEGPCTVQVRARIETGGFGTAPPTDDDVQFTIYGGTCSGCPLTWDGGEGVWTGTVGITAAPADPLVPFDPRMPIEIRWAYKDTSLIEHGVCGPTFDICKDTFGMVQRIFSGSEAYSGPVRSATVVHAADLSDATALRAPGTYSLVAAVRLAGAVATDVNDPVVRLRVVNTSGNASNQSAVDCEQVPTLKEEITKGCQPLYTKNTRLTQPDPCNPPWASDIAMWASPQPWDCVAVKPGGTIGDFQFGLLGRIINNGKICGGGECFTSPWKKGQGCIPASPTGAYVKGRNYWNTFPDLPDGDVRVLTLFMVPFGAFRGHGQGLFPIVNFGAFYVVDWGGVDLTETGGSGPDDKQFDDPCGSEPDALVKEGFVSGHFIQYVESPNSGGGNGQTCNPSLITPCVAVLVE